MQGPLECAAMGHVLYVESSGHAHAGPASGGLQQERPSLQQQQQQQQQQQPDVGKFVLDEANTVQRPARVTLAITMVLSSPSTGIRFGGPGCTCVMMAGS